MSDVVDKVNETAKNENIAGEDARYCVPSRG
jgi:hypothetical protein